MTIDRTDYIATYFTDDGKPVRILIRTIHAYFLRPRGRSHPAIVRYPEKDRVEYWTHDGCEHFCKVLADGSLANVVTGATYRPG